MKNTETTKIFAEKLQDCLSTTNMNINDISIESGVSAGAISKYQNDNGEAGINNLVKLAKYFNVTTDYLLGLSKVQSYDTDKQAVSKYLNLDEKTINCIKESHLNLITLFSYSDMSTDKLQTLISGFTSSIFPEYSRILNKFLKLTLDKYEIVAQLTYIAYLSKNANEKYNDKNKRQTKDVLNSIKYDIIKMMQDLLDEFDEITFEKDEFDLIDYL